MQLIQRSREHLTQNNERYFQHQRFALRYAFGCLQAAFMALIHGLIPAFYPTAASDKVKELASRKREESET